MGFFSQYIVMESPLLEGENIIKEAKNLFRLKRLKKETIDIIIKDIINIFRTEKANKTIKGRILW